MYGDTKCAGTLKAFDKRRPRRPAFDAERLKARLCCTEEEETAHAEALCAVAAAQAAYQFWLLEEAASPKSLTAGEVRAEFDKGSERALTYAKQCERAVSGLLKDEDFYFGVAEGTA